MKEKWNELKKYPLLVLFFVFLFGFMFLDMACLSGHTATLSAVTWHRCRSSA